MCPVVHVAVPFAAPGQSPAAQQLVTGMQAPLHARYPALQDQPHVPFAHEALALAGATQGEHEVPHELTLAFTRHWPLQLWVPLRQVLPQATALSRHCPAQSRIPDGQLAPHTEPSHVADPPTGAVQGVHEVPHEVGETLLRQAAPHRWNPLLQLAMQPWFDPHVAMPLATDGQSADTQQPSFGTHEPSPHFLYPVLHMMSHIPALHVAVPFAGLAHGAHDAPQELGLASAKHRPLQSWLPLGH